MKRATIRPLRILVMTPIVPMLSLTVSIVYGYLYILMTTFTLVFTNQYGFTTGTSGLSYLGLAVGFITGLVFSGYASDRIAARMREEGVERKPEHRLPPMVVGAFAIPIGLFIYGWTAQFKVHWMVPILGTGLFGFGMLSMYMPVQAYMIDAFTIYAASANAGNIAIRSTFGAILPLAGPPLYATLGLGWGNSLLGFISVATIPIPFLLLRYGERIRTRFPIEL